MEKLTLNAPNIVDGLNQIHSIFPCEGYLTFGAWIYLVPQYKPESVLMLGYGGGTAAGLIRKFYGDIPITAVDMLDCSEFNFYDVEMIIDDALKFVLNTERKFDSVIVDLYREGSYQAESFVFTKEFVNALKRIANYVIIHAVIGDDMSQYSDLRHIRTLSLNSGGPYEPHFHYFMVNDIPSLPIR